MKTIGNRITAARAAKGWSQKRLAEELGCKPEQISMWESARRTPRPKALGHLAQSLNVSYTWLHTGQGPMNVSFEQLMERDYGMVPIHVAASGQTFTPAQELVLLQFQDILRRIPDEAVVRWWQRLLEILAPEEPRPTDTLAERLQAARRASGMTLEQVSRRLKSVRPDLPEMKPFEYETDPAYLEAIEAGSIVPPPTLLANLAVVYRVPASALSTPKPAAPEASDDETTIQPARPMP